LNTFVQGAWSVLLARYSGQADVVFGVTFAGRPPGLRDVESMVGLFANTLPLRVRVPRREGVLAWLARLQAEHAELLEHAQAGLIEVQGWSEVPSKVPLFESMLAFESYPIDPSVLGLSGELEARNLRMFEKTNYPLTVIAMPGAGLVLRIVYDRRRFDDG